MPDKQTTPPGSAMIPQTATPKAGGSARVDEPRTAKEGGSPSGHTLTPRPDPTPDQWYVDRRVAIMEGDSGTLPSGDTCAEQRAEYSDMAVAETAPAAATLASLTPASSTVGAADFTLQAIGTGFESGDQIVINSVPSTTTFVSQTELSTPITGSTLIAGSFPVVVRRGAVDTAPQMFTVT